MPQPAMGGAKRASSIAAMAAAVPIEVGDPFALVVVGRRLGFPPAARGSMLSTVGSLEAGQPSSARMSFGDSTPTCRARSQDAQRASGSQELRPRGATTRGFYVG
jgi:hypothetical protein